MGEVKVQNEALVSRMIKANFYDISLDWVSAISDQEKTSLKKLLASY